MAHIEASTHVRAPPARVWAELVDWEGQSRWMVDARSVAVLGERREGVGTVLRCRTDIAAGLVVTDDMEVVEWCELERIGVRHLGWLIRGVGAFELSPTPHGTRLTWWEELLVPFGEVGDAVAGLVVSPLVTRTFHASLTGLKRLCEVAPQHHGT